MKTKLDQSAVAFFLEHAGWSYNPATETPEQGRLRCARSLAKAERWLSEQNGHQVKWVEDTDYSPDDYDYPPENDTPGLAWGCVIDLDGERGASLWAITFEGNGEPWGKPYARVVVAELAYELMPE